jgi:hypothetical protein
MGGRSPKPNQKVPSSMRSSGGWPLVKIATRAAGAKSDGTLARDRDLPGTAG